MQSIGHVNFNSELLNVIYDNIVDLKNGKEYEDIIDRAELQNTDFLYVYDSKGKIGVINRNNANEVVTPVAVPKEEKYRIQYPYNEINLIKAD